jgi:hypothetical protein
MAERCLVLWLQLYHPQRGHGGAGRHGGQGRLGHPRAPGGHQAHHRQHCQAHALDSRCTHCTCAIALHDFECVCFALLCFALFSFSFL